MVASAFLGLSKPVVIWNHDNTYPWGARDPTTAFAYRRMLAAHLLLGVLPSLPFVECDHCLNTKNSTVPETVWRPAHEAYGPLFTLLRGRQWVFTAGAITTDARASMRSNVFTTHDGRRMVAPLISVAPNQQQTNVTILLPSSLTENCSWAAAAPLKPGTLIRRLRHACIRQSREPKRTGTRDPVQILDLRSDQIRSEI